MRFSTFTSGLRDFKEWLRLNDCYEARREGRKERDVEIARTLLNIGDPINKIIMVTGLSLEEIESLSNK